MSEPADLSGATDQVTDAILSRQRIADLTTAYCRGVDRADEALLKSLFHDDSIVAIGAFNGNGQQFAAEICGVLRAVFDQSFHTITSQSIEVTGDTAVGETYVIAVSTMTDLDTGKSEMVTGGRYFDRFSRRNGVWKFAARRFVSDWSRVDKTSGDMNDGPDVSPDHRHRQGPDDPACATWN